MPRKTVELSAIEVRNLQNPGLHAVGGVPGLYLQIKPSGAKSWILRYSTGATRPTSTGRTYVARRDIGIGGFPEIGLAAAREKARALREQIRQGIDPVAERKAARERLLAAQQRITFKDATRRFLAFKAQEFRSAKHAAQWRTSLERYAYPTIGDMAVADIRLEHVMTILEPLWLSKTETLKRVQGRIENVLDWASARGYRTGDNPARWRGNLDALLPAPGKIATVKHHRALPIDAVPVLYADLCQQPSVAALALRFLLLTGTRSGDVRGAVWSEVDMAARVWTIPAARLKVKNRGDHRVPLSDEALVVLGAVPRVEGCPWVFTRDGERMLGSSAMALLMQRMGIDAVPHGLRSTFRDWIEERTSYPHAVAEQALAHVIASSVERAYRRGDLLAKRARLMADWARFCAAPVPAAAGVTAIRV